MDIILKHLVYMGQSAYLKCKAKRTWVGALPRVNWSQNYILENQPKTDFFKVRLRARIFRKYLNDPTHITIEIYDGLYLRDMYF